MKLAVNYSKALMTLLEKDPSMPVGYIKVPTVPFPECWYQFDEGEQKRDLLPHLAQPGIISLGRTEPKEQFDPVTVLRIIQRTGAGYLSTHVESRIDFFPEFIQYQHLHHPVVQQVLLEHFSKVISIIKGYIQIPLVLENFPYYIWWQHYKTGSNPEFLSELCESTNCDFLLDIAHARCTAWHTDMDIYDYLNALPLHRVREIHLAGTRERPEEGLRDTHAAIGHAEYELLKYLLQKTDPEIVTIEYGGMPEKIMNTRGEYEPISRNDMNELEEAIRKVSHILGLPFYG